MSDMSLANEMHDKATRGASLSNEETAFLEKWYVEQDRAELAALTIGSSPMAAALQANIEAAAAQLTGVSQQILALTRENEALRREVAALSQQLGHRSTPQPA